MCHKKLALGLLPYPNTYSVTDSTVITNNEEMASQATYHDGDAKIAFQLNAMKSKTNNFSCTRIFYIRQEGRCIRGNYLISAEGQPLTYTTFKLKFASQLTTTMIPPKRFDIFSA